jgi:hypothetical protein
MPGGRAPHGVARFAQRLGQDGSTTGHILEAICVFRQHLFVLRKAEEGAQGEEMNRLANRQSVDIVKFGSNSVVMSVEIPFDESFSTSLNELNEQVVSPTPTMVYGELKRAADVLFPDNPISSILLQSQIDRIAGFFYLQKPFGTAGAPNGNLDTESATGLARAFVMGVVNQFVGTRGYSATTVNDVTSREGASYGSIAYTVGVILH